MLSRLLETEDQCDFDPALSRRRLLTGMFSVIAALTSALTATLEPSKNDSAIVPPPAA